MGGEEDEERMVGDGNGRGEREIGGERVRTGGVVVEGGGGERVGVEKGCAEGTGGGGGPETSETEEEEDETSDDEDARPRHESPNAGGASRVGP